MNEDKKKISVEDGFDDEDLNRELKKPKQHYAFISTTGGFIVFLIVVFCSVWFPNQTQQKKMQEDVKQYVIAVLEVNSLNGVACFSKDSDKEASDQFTAYYGSDLTRGFLEAFGKKADFSVDNMQLVSETEGFVPVELTVPDWEKIATSGILTQEEISSVFGGAENLTQVLERPQCQEVFEKLKVSTEEGTLPTTQSVIQVSTVKEETDSPWRIVFTSDTLLETVGDWTVLQ